MTDRPTPTQAELIPLSKDEIISHLAAALKKRGTHSLYCHWDRVAGRYEDGPCTCGLDSALELVDD